MLQILILGIALAAFVLSGTMAAGGTETIPSPLQQVQEGVPFDEIQCRDGKVPMQSPGGTPACVSESSSTKLVEMGWKAVAGSQTNQEAARGGHACRDQQETANVGKFDPGLFDRIGEMLNANVTGSYSVLLIVSDGDMQAVEQILVDCHGATDVAAASSLSFVTASVPLGEIQALSAYDEVRQIGAGELFEIPAVLDYVEGTTWVQIDPVQCGGNPWGDARSSPDVIKEYYADLGVDVFDLKVAHTHQLICAACSCPDGITLSLRVSHDDVRTMLSLGFMPPDKQPDAPRKPRLSSADIENTGDRPFVTTWRTISPNESITIPVGNATGAYTVDWGDGSVSANVTGDQSHAYLDAGEYTVRISGDFTRILFAEDHDNAYKIVSIEQWGDTQWKSMASTFRGVAFTSHAADTPDLSKVTDMSGMFQDSDFNGDLSGWDVSKVTDMSGMFQDSGFNDDISNWDVSSVKDMHRMFTHSVFNGDISGWDVSGVEDMGYMFSGTPFNGDISGWDVSGVEDMGYMFSGTPFNGDISGWDVSGVSDMSSMFRYASFNGDISGWDVSGVSDMYDMFSYSDFNGDISGWDVSGVEDMGEMFFASSFRGDISGWDVSGVEDMHKMFASSVFNGDISGWDVSGVEDMSGMFRNALFLGGIAGWDVSSVKDMSEMFLDTPFFHSHLSGWDVSGVENMHMMFRESSFNGDVSGWDVSGVKNMSEMFAGTPFNGDVSGWDVSGVKNMYGMFAGTPFNGDVSGWDVSGVKNMREMFSRASSFNGDVSDWDVSGVKNMYGMFAGTPFNGDVSDWDVSGVEDMGQMFSGTPFNGDISGWDVSGVKNMGGMFISSSFNGDVSGWDVSSVEYMGDMFRYASFNGDVSGWDVSSVKNMPRMFHTASSFNGDVSGWDVSNVETMSQMFSRASSFVQNLGNWYVVLDSTSINIGSGTTNIGSIAAQNPILDGQNPTYGIGTGADSALFEIDGDILMTKPSVDYGKAEYAVNITSTGDFGVNNFRVISVTVTGADYDETTPNAVPTNGDTSDTNMVLSSSNCNPECIAMLKSWLDTSSPLTIEFDRFVDDSIDGEEGLYVQYSTDGTTWITLASYTEDNNQDTDEWEVTSLTLDIEQNSASLRFVAKSNAPDEFIEIDNLSIYPKGADPVAP